MRFVIAACLAFLPAGKKGEHGDCGQNGACQSGQCPWSVVNTLHKRCMESPSGAGAAAPWAGQLLSPGFSGKVND